MCTPDADRRVQEWRKGTRVDADERTQLGQHEDQTFSTGGPLLEAVNTGRIDMARVPIDHGADPNAQMVIAGSPTDRAAHTTVTATMPDSKTCASDSA